MPDLLSQHAFAYRNDALRCEDVPLADLAAEYGTPLYVYSKRQILENFRAFSSALALEDSRHYVSYAVKANSNIEILRLLAAEGAGAEVVSGGELMLARAAGFSASVINFDGVGKRDEEIVAGLEENILAFDVESEEELQVINDLAAARGQSARVSIRVNPDVDAKSHPYISTGMAENKFGVDIATALGTFEKARDLPHLEVVGIHTHIGSQITSLSPFIEAALSIAEFVDRLRSIGIRIEHLNFGGGQGIRYMNVLRHPLLPSEPEDREKIPALEKFVHVVIPLLRETGCTLVFEPGRAIVANAGALLTRVLFTKATPAKEFCIVDAGMNDLIRPCLYDAYHQIVPCALDERPIRRVDVVGPVCETSDFLALNRELADPRRGDLLAAMCAGAYGYSLASNYNMRARPAEVLVDGGSARLIRERERISDLIAAMSVTAS
jgi:diaminopimelate decarboxylase